MSQEKTYKSFLEITDLPQDKLQALGKLRTVLVGAFNKAREHKHRMALLKAVIKFMHTKIVEFEAEALESEAAKTKAKTTTKTETKVPSKETK